MGYYTLTTQPVQDKVPESYRYIFINKEYPVPQPPAGKKRLTKEQKEKYEKACNDRKTMFAMLNSGTYDIGNGKIRLEKLDSEYSTTDIKIEKHFVYKIIPINAYFDRGSSWSRREGYYVSKFNVEKKIESVYELIDDLIDSETLYEVLSTVLKHGSYSNDGYREEAFEIFRYIKAKYPNKEIFLYKLLIIPDSLTIEFNNSFNVSPQTEEYIQSLLNEGLISLYEPEQWWDSEIIEHLLSNQWFNIAKEFALQVPENLRDRVYNWLRDSEFVRKVTRENSDQEIVREFSNLIGIGKNDLTLTVIRDGDFFDEDEIIEEVSFKNMPDVRTYVIRKYGVPYDRVKDEPYRWRGENDECFRVE